MTCSESYRLFKNFIKEGCKGKTVIFSAMDNRFLHLSTNFIYMEDGKIERMGRKEELREFSEFEGVNLDENCVKFNFY